MPDRLLLRLAADGRLTWLVQGADGRARADAVTGAPPSQVLEKAAHITVLVPSADVLLLEAPAPTRQRSQLQRAVPFAVEDQLAQPVEDLHFALAPDTQDGRIGVAVVAREKLRHWLQQLAEAGVQADVLLPESLALAPGHLLIEPAHATLRIAPWRAAAIDTAALAQWLALCAPELTQGLVVADARYAPRASLPVAVGEYHERVRDPLAWLAAELPGEGALNLLQGDFAARHRAAPAARLWRIAAMCAAAALCAAFAYAVAERELLQRESARLDDAMHSVLVQSFPEMEKVAGEPAKLMQSSLARLGGGDQGGLLRLLGQVAPVLGSTTRLTTRGFEFRNGTLELSLVAPDVPTLDLLRERLAMVPGLKVELTAANPGENGVEGRIRIVGGGA